MTHVTQQIAGALRTILKTIPEFGDRVYPLGAVGWDQRTFPIAVVSVEATDVATERSPAGYPRMQTRTSRVVVEVHDLMTVGTDFAGQVAGLVSAVEVAAPALSSACGIEECSLLSTTGILDPKHDEAGVHAAQSLSFQVLCHTIEGKPDAFADLYGD